MSRPTVGIGVTPYYGGGQVANPLNVISYTGTPTFKMSLPVMSVDSTNDAFYVETSPGVWVQGGSSSGGVTTIVTSPATSPVTPSGGSVTFTAGSGITLTGSGNTLTISGTAGLSWTSVSVSTSMLTNKGYIVTGSSAVTLTMPSVASVGDEVGLIVSGTGQITVKLAGSGQSVRILSSTQGTSTGGFISAATGTGYSIIFICTTASTSSTTGAWIAISSEGTWTPN